MPDRNSPTTELEDEVRRLWNTNPYPSLDDFTLRFINAYSSYCEAQFGAYPAKPIGIALCIAAENFYKREPRSNYSFTGRQQFQNPIAHGRYRDTLLKLIKAAHESCEDWLTAFIAHILAIYDPFIRALPN